MKNQTDSSVVSSILLRSSKGGPCRVFIVQTRNHAEAAQVEGIFQELEERCSVRPLALGITTAFAVQSCGELELLEAVETVLKDNFKFSVVYVGFNEIIHRIVEDLALETGSRLLRIPVCQSCGSADPFPTQLTVQRGLQARTRAVFCDQCVAAMGGEEEPEGICRLLNKGIAPEALVSTPATEVVHKRSLLRRRLARRPFGPNRQPDRAHPVERDLREPAAAEPQRLAS